MGEVTIKQEGSSRWLFRALLVIGVVLALAVVGRAVPLQAALDWLRDRAGELGVWAALAFGGIFVAATLILVPGWPMTVAAGAVFGAAVGTLVMWLAAVVSASAAFFLGRLFGRDRAARQLAAYPRLRLLYHTLGDRDGWKLVIAVRLSHALPFGLQGMLFGLTPISFWTYLLSSALIMLPGTFVYAYLGHVGAIALEASALDTPPQGGHPWLFQLLGLIVAVLSLAYVARHSQRVLTALPDPQ